VLKGPVSVSGLSSTAGHFNLVGNPFQSLVDMSFVINASTNLTPFYYVYDPVLGGTPIVGVSGGRGAYVAVNTFTGATSNSLSAVNVFLQPYQAFYVQTNTLNTTPQITFNETDKVTSSVQTNVFRSTNEVDVNNKFISLSLFSQAAFDSNDSSLDGLRIDFSTTANNDVDAFDAVKFPNSDENISRNISETLISMENRGTAQNGELLPLRITNYRTTAYAMQISISDFPNQNVYLKDLYTNQNILLTNNATSNYSFVVNDADPASINADRFAFAFQDSQLGTDQSNFGSAFTLFPNPASGSSIFLNSKLPFENAQIEVYNLLGQKVGGLETNFGTNNQISIPIADLSAGVYVIKVTTNTGVKYSAKFSRN
jgi:hypothetical protein